MPSSCTAHSCSMSAMPDRPPEAITGMLSACASATVASMLMPESMPSRPMSVEMMDSRPQSSNFRARSTTPWPVSLLQPSVATLPSRASSPTMMWPPNTPPPPFQKAGILHRSSADDDVAQAAIDVFFDGVQVADAAAELHRNVVAHLLEDGFDGAVVLGHAGQGAVQVHQVQAPGAGVDPLARHRSGVFPKGGGLVHIALPEAQAITVLEIDGGDEQHGGFGWKRARRNSARTRLKGSGVPVQKIAVQS